MDNPTNNPTNNQTDNPTGNPIYNPADNPTNNPTDNQTNNQTNNPADSPTYNPITNAPTDAPIDAPEEILFINQYLRTKEMFKEIFQYSFTKSPRMIFIFIVVLVVIISSIFLIYSPGRFQFNYLAVIYLCIVAIFIFTLIFRYFQSINLSYKRDLEISNGVPAEIRMSLTDNTMESYNVFSESKFNISYKSVKKVIIIKNYYLLLTEAKHYIVIKKDGFIKGAPEEFLAFIQTKVVKSG